MWDKRFGLRTLAGCKAFAEGILVFIFRHLNVK